MPRHRRNSCAGRRSRAGRVAGLSRSCRRGPRGEHLAAGRQDRQLRDPRRHGDLLRAQAARDYFASRRAQVRSDLVAAEEMKKSAAAQIAEMDAKLQALPAELDALKARGQQEIAAEEQRIRELAETERARLLEQASREIAQRTRAGAPRAGRARRVAGRRRRPDQDQGANHRHRPGAARRSVSHRGEEP